MKRFLIVISVIFLSVFAFFFSNIKGYYRFEQYCEAEGGLKVHEPLSRGVGWLADDYDSAHMAARLNGVGFVRYTDRDDGNTYDLRYIGGNPQRESSYEKSPADREKQLIYRWVNIGEAVQQELRLRRFGEKVVDIVSSKTAASYYMFSYQIFDPGHVSFGEATKEYCFLEPARSVGKIDGWIIALNKAFRN